MFVSSFRLRTHSIFLTVAMLAALLFAPSAASAANPVPGADFSLTILHNNDGESQLINAGSGLEDFGGVARFKTMVDGLRADATAAGNGVLMLSSGDNFLAGPEFNASLDNGIPFYDTIAMEAIGYDAVSLGNHDFDFGPDVLTDFLSSYTVAPPYLSSNLDFTGEPGLQAFVDSGVIAPSTVVSTGGQDIGIVGAVTPTLNSISSPRNVAIDFDVAGAIQTEVDALIASGINKIVVISHLQDITEDIALAAELTGVDVMIAGGGDELLANPGDPLVPGEEGDVFGAYPLTATGMDGAQIPVVTTPGEYKYLGRLTVGFDSDGNVTGVGTDSGPKVVDSSIVADPGLQASVVDPVSAAVAALDADVIGTSEVALDGTRTGVRGMETNQGNLIADALLWQATELATAFGVNAPDVALQNGGGIRNNTVIAAGDISVLDTFDMVPFSNFVTVLEDIPRDQFKEILENAYSQVPGGGRFAQVAGFEVVYDPFGFAMITDNATGDVTQVGNRIVDVMLDDGTVLVSGGTVVPGDPITIATIDFLARGGDQYPYRGAPFTTLGVTYQQATANFIEDGLSGTISAADYPEGGEGRITLLPAATDFGLVIHHNNDAESQLINAGSGLEGFGGVARFSRLLNERRWIASDARFGEILLSSGDNFLAGPEFNASLENGVPFYDTIAMDMLGYDAIAIGNHDFDFGPDILADFIDGYSLTMPPYVSANLGFADEPRLQALADAGRIVSSTVINERGVDIGIVGATTPQINFISSPRDVDVMDDVAGIVQAEVDTLTAAGIEIIILISHLQDIDEDIALAALLSDVDVMIAGGGDELLANPGDVLIPGDEGDVFGTYPMVATDADGADLPVVTTSGEYKYLGELWIGFDSDGKSTLWAGQPLRVTNGANNDIFFAAVDPVIDAIADLDATVIGTSEVALDGTRTGVRGMETNQGNLIADALKWSATRLAGSFGVKAPDIALQNGGGIRNNTVIAAGDITLLDTFDMVPFPNFVTVLEDIPRDQVKEILENAYSQTPGGGRFAQISGLTVRVDIGQTAQTLDDDDAVVVPGERILEATLDDGTVLVEDGAVVAGDPITIATIDFLARGGDQYPYRGAPFTSVGVSYQQALADYIVDGLESVISAANYPEGGEGRITILETLPIEGPFTPIYDIQGGGDESPLDGEVVETSGYVTGVFPGLGGFYLQDGTGDGDATTSDGIFVAVNNGVVVGDHAEVRGTVDEFFGETRIVDVDAVEVEGTGGSIAGTEVSLPLADGVDLEHFEGMLITFPEYLYVSDMFNLHRFGEAILAEGGVLVNPTEVATPGDAANALAATNSARSIVIDDGTGSQFPDEVPYFADDGTLRRGDADDGITANLSFSFGAYKLQPTEDVSFERMNPRPDGLDNVGGTIQVASFNVHNYFSTIDDGNNNARGAHSIAEKAMQLDQLVSAINGMGAEIVGLQELENNGPVAIGELVDGLNADAGAGTWAAVPDPVYPGGLETTNAIKVGIIYQPAMVTPVGASEVDEDPVFGTDRPPIAQTFTAFGDTFTVVVNHFKSKSSSNAEGLDVDQGDGQGAYNFRRTNQANALVAFMDELATATGDPDVLAVGDFNSYTMEDPITALESAGLTNLVKDGVTVDDRYSFVFFGAQGLLDGAFATDSLDDKVTGVDIWHMAADEPRVLQYNDDIIDPGERSSDFNQPVALPDEFASSDHDAVLVGLQLGDGPMSLSFSNANNRATPAMLDGANVSGHVYPFVVPLDPGLGFTTVDFYLDGVHARTEYLSPYDFAGGLTTIATSWDSSTVADGAHVMKAVGNLPDGSTVSTEATFTVNNAPAPAGFGLSYSAAKQRTPSHDLEGAYIVGDAFIFVEPLFPGGFQEFNRVMFYLDGTLVRTEYAAPYDFTGGGVAAATTAWDSTTVADGEHEIMVKVVRQGMAPLATTVKFNVSNDTAPPPPPPEPPLEAVRFATFNASLNRFNGGDLVADLSTPDNAQAKVIAEIIQRARPEVLLLNEFDYDASGEAARLFQENYLSVPQNGAEPIVYGYAFSAESNTGIASGVDLDNSGDVGGPNDAFGFGFFPGQFGMQVYSQHPIDFANVRTFQKFLWKDMPGAMLPVDPDTSESYYSDEALAVFRLSSKSHWDVPVGIDGHTVNFLVSHPTPPVFDGPEDRNGTRNFDEIRFWSDYVNGAGYMYDDNGKTGGWSGDYFVIAGDQNSDPLDGDSIPGSAQLLLNNARVNATMTPSSLGAVEQNGLQAGANLSHLSDPANDTADFNDNPAPGNLRADYVLPSANLDIAASGVFWPEASDPLFTLVGTFPFPGTDHRLVWVDLGPGSAPLPPAVPLPNVVGSVAKAPIVPDGDVAGAVTDFVITLNRSLDPAVPGRSLTAGSQIRITLPDAFIDNGFDTGAPGAVNCVPGPCNLGVVLQGWPQHPIAPPAAKYSLERDGTHTFVYTALEDLSPAGPLNPGVKQMHLILLGFQNPAAGDYEIIVETQTGQGGAWETGVGTLTIRPAIAPSINVTSVFNEGTPNTIYQTTVVGQATPLAYDFLLWDAAGDPMTGVSLDGGVLMRDGVRVGEVTITAPDGATGQGAAVAAPSVEITAPVLGVPTARLTAVFTAGSVAGDYTVTFSLDAGTSQTMYVTATSAP